MTPRHCPFSLGDLRKPQRPRHTLGSPRTCQWSGYEFGEGRPLPSNVGRVLVPVKVPVKPVIAEWKSTSRLLFRRHSETLDRHAEADQSILVRKFFGVTSSDGGGCVEDRTRRFSRKCCPIPTLASSLRSRLTRELRLGVPPFFRFLPRSEREGCHVEARRA